MQIVVDIPNPPSEQRIINVPIHFCGGQVVDAGEYGFEERKTGKWLYDISSCDAIEAMFTLPKCSLCGAETSHAKAMYCPNCGAKMEGADDDAMDSVWKCSKCVDFKICSKEAKVLGKTDGCEDFCLPPDEIDFP